MTEALNDKPFSFSAKHGCQFKAEFCDFRTGLKVVIPRNYSPDILISDTAQMTGYHARNILPKLDDFSGYNSITYKVVTEDEEWIKENCPKEGRNFYDVVKGEKITSSADKRDAIQVADYLVMDVSRFKAWYSLSKWEKNDTLKKEGPVFVVIKEISDGKILVEADDVQKWVDASLFFNHYISFYSTEADRQ